MRKNCNFEKLKKACASHSESRPSPEMPFFVRELKAGEHDSEELRSARFDKLERTLGSKKTAQRDKTLWLAFFADHFKAPVGSAGVAWSAG